MRISDWSSDVCSSDLVLRAVGAGRRKIERTALDAAGHEILRAFRVLCGTLRNCREQWHAVAVVPAHIVVADPCPHPARPVARTAAVGGLSTKTAGAVDVRPILGDVGERLIAILGGLVGVGREF